MSLINDALKKAQKQRTEERPSLSTMPGIGGEPAARIAKRARPLEFNSLLVWIGLGAGTLLVLVIGGFFLVRWIMSRPETPPPVKPALIAQTTPQSAEPASARPAASNSSNAYVLPAAPAVAAVTVAENKSAVTTPVAPPPEPEAPKPAAPALKLESKAVVYIEALRVAGVRASATDSKVLMNDRVYRVGDTVEHQLGLKLTAITASSLTFEDERGARYTRNL